MQTWRGGVCRASWLWLFGAVGAATVSGCGSRAVPRAANAPVAAQAPAPPAPPVVVLETSEGTIELELDPDHAPKSVEAFLGYVRDGFYDGTVFHRVIRGYVVQGGGYTRELKPKKAGAAVLNESANGLKNLRGTLGLARARRKPDSATSQFYINSVDNPGLDPTGPDGGFTVFGKVVSGMDVVDRIGEARTTEQAGMKDVPSDPVVITAARLKDAAARPAGEGSATPTPGGIAR